LDACAWVTYRSLPLVDLAKQGGVGVIVDLNILVLILSHNRILDDGVECSAILKVPWGGELLVEIVVFAVGGLERRLAFEVNHGCGLSAALLMSLGRFKC
jgi:hypothetical protein